VELLAAALAPGESAPRLLGAVAAAREHLDLPDDPSVRPLVDDAVDECRRELGDEVFQDAWSAGSSLSIDEAIELALSLTEEGVNP
jgi:hypothetical protein